MDFNKIASTHGLKLKQLCGKVGDIIADITKEGKIVGHWNNGEFDFLYENSIIDDDNVKKVMSEAAHIKTIHDAFEYFSKGIMSAIIIDDSLIVELPSVVSMIMGELKDTVEIKVGENNNTSASDYSEIASGNPFVMNLWGKLLAFRGNTSKASECFRQAVEMERSYSEPYSNLGTLLWQAGKQREAFLLFCEALIKNPDSHIAQMNFFDAGYELLEYKAILTILDHVLKDGVLPVEFNHHRAICHFKLGEKDTAIGIVNSILENNPVDTEALELKTTMTMS